MALFSTPQTTQQLPVGFSPQQTGVMNQLLPFASGGLQNLLGGGNAQQPTSTSVGFEPFAQQARQQFQQQTIPGIAERFTGMGAGAQQSSAFPQILGQAGAGLESSLAALGAQHGLQQQQFGLQERGLQQQQRGMDINALMELLQTGLTPQSQTQIIPAQRGELSKGAGQLGSLLLTLLPMLLGGALGGPAGAAGGAAVGGGLSALLG